uniref:Bcl-2/adenovirus E1B 19 kDa-interacting protein 2-like protein n=1 Tax=Zeugodacus cucurbitae TaxID=28588 RepID=A0A0A1WK33_ZEUCU
MVGPFMQGVLLMGIIYWYTKGMLSLINDYYRSEIQRKMQIDEPLNETSDFIYVDQIVEHHLAKLNEGEQQQTVGEITEELEINVSNEVEMEKQIFSYEDVDTRHVCRRAQRLEEFFRLVKVTKNICWLNETIWATKI